METDTLSLNKFQNQEIKISCRSCNLSTYHKILFSAEVDWNDHEYDMWQWSSYQIAQCLGCHDVSFRKISTSSEDVDIDQDGEVRMSEICEIYPSRVEGTKQMSEVWYLPGKTAMIYRETHSALCNKMPVLAGIGIRALVESVCNEKKAIGSDLEKKIDNLVQIGILTKEGAELLHGTRILGNKAAHEIVSFPESDLKTAMNVVEHLLAGAYIMPMKAKNLPQRKKQDLQISSIADTSEK
jgi:hypothetical protein